MRYSGILMIFILSFFSCQNNQERMSYLESRCDSQQNDNDRIRFDYHSSYFMQLDSINKELEVTTTNLDTCCLDRIMNSPNRLFFHYSDLHCSSCLDVQLEKLLQLQTDFGANSICILASVRSYRSIVSLIKNNGFRCEIFKIPQEKSIFVKQPFISEPFYFTLVNNRIDLFHIPEVKDAISTNIFLKLCKETLIEQ